MKIGPLTIFIIGFAVGLIAMSYAYFHKYKPNMAEAQVHAQHAVDLQREANKMPQAQRRVERAKAQVERMAAEWAQIAETKTPPDSVEAGGINLAKNRLALVTDAKRFRNNIQRAVNRQLLVGGVEVVTGVTIPSPSESAADVVETFFNYPAVAFPVCVFEFNNVQVRGTYSQIKEHIKAWARMPNYMAVVDGLNLTGTSPTMTATYSLNIVAFIRGREVSPPVGGAPVAPAGGGGGGGGGGRQGV